MKKIEMRLTHRLPALNVMMLCISGQTKLNVETNNEQTQDVSGRRGGQNELLVQVTEGRDQSEIGDRLSLGWVGSDRDWTSQDVSDWIGTGETGSKQVRVVWDGSDQV